LRQFLNENTSTLSLKVKIGEKDREREEIKGEEENMEIKSRKDIN
jgi:hypothetical protein